MGAFRLPRCLLAALAATTAASLAAGEVERRLCRPDDLLTSLSDPDPQVNALLARYNFPAEPFPYELRLAGASEVFRQYRLTFPSPRKWDIPQCNTVEAEYYVPAKRGRPAPAVVVLHILDGRFAVARLVCRAFAAGGVPSLLVKMPYYGERRPAGLDLPDVFLERPERMVWAIEGAVAEVRRAAVWLRKRQEVDARRVGIVGVSLGGLVAALSVGVDPSFDRNVLILAGGDPAAILWTAPETRFMRERLAKKGYDLAGVRRLAAAIDPRVFAHRADPRRILMINATEDRTVARAKTEELWKRFGRPKIEWYPAGHYSLALFIPVILPRALDFVTRLPPR